MLLLKIPGVNFSIWLSPKSLRERYSVDLGRAFNILFVVVGMFVYALMVRLLPGKYVSFSNIFRQNVWDT